MVPVLLLLSVFFGYLIMYRFYGRYLSRRIFGVSPERVTPSVALEDGVDYVPTRKQVIFGHHFASIAGTGPIVGPAIAIIWGWVPALVWIFVGSVFMGAVHDFGSLIISLRNQGKSISDYTSKYVNARTRWLFFLIVFLELWIVISVFGVVIASIFKIFSTSVWPFWLQIPIAVFLGWVLYKKGGNLFISTLGAVAVMYLTIWAGSFFPVELPVVLGIPPTGTWTIILLLYAFIASVLPVTWLLQPRDFINAYQLVLAMSFMAIGVLVTGLSGRLHMVAPAMQLHPEGAPPLIPFLFITIACGAISGFHSLVSSGTTSKQIRNEKDALFVGYGSMLTEGLLALLVLIAVGAGIGLGMPGDTGRILTGPEAWQAHYFSWSAAGGLDKNLGAFVQGASNMLSGIGIPPSVGVVIMGVFVASFAGTTLDSATRIQRYAIGEIFSGAKIKLFQNKYVTSAIAVLSSAALAFATGADGTGALKLWPLFGAVNQTLAALALIIVTIYLKDRGGLKWLFSGIPAVVMSVVTLWATVINQKHYFDTGNHLLVVVNFIVLIIMLWIMIEGYKRLITPAKNYS